MHESRERADESRNSGWVGVAERTVEDSVGAENSCAEEHRCSPVAASFENSALYPFDSGSVKGRVQGSSPSSQ